MFTSRATGGATGRHGRAAIMAAALAATLLAGAAGAGAARDPGLLSGISRTVCAYNLAQLAEAYQLFQLQQKREPESLAELLADRFVRPPRCPAGGQFRLTPAGNVTCSVHDRQQLRVTRLGTHRTWPSTSQVPPAYSFRRAKDRAVYFLAGWEPDGGRHTVEIQWTEAGGRRVQVDRFAAYARAEVATAFSLTGRPTGELPAGEYRATLMLDGESAGSATFWLVD